MDNSQQTQIEKLMELKRLYEQGILIKEEMEAEKHMILREYDGNIKAGIFEETMGVETYSGTFTNSKGKTFPFSANVVIESD